MAKRNYIGEEFYPNQGYGVGIQRGRIENKQGNLDEAIKTINAHRSDFTDDEWNSFNFNDGLSIQQFINRELARLGGKYNREYGRIQEDGIVGNQTAEALNYVLNNRHTKDRMANPNDSDVTYGQHAVGFIGGDENGLKMGTAPVVQPSPVQNVPIKPYGQLQKGDYYGKFNNFATMRDYAMSNPESNFGRLATDYLKSKGLNWNSASGEIEKAFNVSGNYHRGRGGDLYDIGQVLNTYAGSVDPGLEKARSQYAQNLFSKIKLRPENRFNYTIQRFQLNSPLSTNNGDFRTLIENIINKRNNNFTYYKTGGQMTQKYQQGGAAPQGDPQEQIIQLVQAAMGGDQQASAQIQQIMQAAQQGDQQAAQLAEMIMQIANQMQGGVPEQQGGAQVARNGAKLNYIKRLKGECPEGYEMTYFKAGGKVCKKCQKKVEKACGGKQLAKCGTKFHKAGGVMESILSEMFAKGGAMNRNKHTAFGEERGANVVSTNHAGRWGGRRAFNSNGTHQLNKHDKPNKFTAFGDEGKKKPTNVGLVGHHATGKTGRMQNRQKAGTTYKATAFGGEKQKRFHRGAKASSIGRIGLIKGYPKGHGGKSGIGKI